MTDLFIRKQRDFRVVIEPRDLGDLGMVRLPTHWVSDNLDKDYRRRCDEIAQDVKRHVENVGGVTIESTTYEVCPYCGAEIEPDDLLPSCCDALIHSDAYTAEFQKRLTAEIERLEKRLATAREYLDYVTPEAQS